jgi:SprT-like family
MRTASQALPRASRRPAAATPSVSAQRRPLQLELFGRHSSASPAALGPSGRTLSRPVIVPSPDAPRLELQRALNRLMGGRLKTLILTENRRTILSVRAGSRPSDRTQLAVRLHRCFLGAPPEVVEAVAVFLDSKKGSDGSRDALRVIRRHFADQGGDERARARRSSLRPVGVAVDLREIVADLNLRYFDGRLKVNVTWGRGAGTSQPCRRRTRTSSLQLGSYSYEDKLIRLHRVLDQPGVPRHVLEAVVYHELLHADLPPVIRNGRRYFHTPEFHRRERLYRHLDKANRWIQEHLQDLLRSRQATRRRAPAI